MEDDVDSKLFEHMQYSIGGIPNDQKASGVNPVCSICNTPGCTYLNHMVNPVDPVDVQQPVGVLQEAATITEVRQGEYGEPIQHFRNVANAWEAILHTKITSEQVILCMIALKVLREANLHKHDNLVDIAGYARLLERVKS